MSQRITMSLLVVALLLATGAMGMFYQEGRSLRAQSESLLARTEELAHTLQAKLATLEVSNDEQAQEETPLSLEWTKLQIRLVQEKKGGHPAAGFTAILTGSPINPAEKLALWEESGEEGLIQFGPIRPGGYRLSVISPWGNYHDHVLQNQSSLVLLPGRTTELEIVCPSKAEETAEIAFRIDWPEEIAEKTPLLFCRFTAPALDESFDIDGAYGGRWWLTERDFDVTLNREGKVLENYSRLPMLNWPSQPRPEVTARTRDGGSLRFGQLVSAHSFRGSERLSIGGVRAGPLHLHAGGTVAETIEFVVETDLASRATIRTDVRRYSLNYCLLLFPADQEEIPGGGRAYNAYHVKPVTPSEEVGFQSFEAVPGELNTWQIRLPEIVMTEVPEQPEEEEEKKPARGRRR